MKSNCQFTAARERERHRGGPPLNPVTKPTVTLTNSSFTQNLLSRSPFPTPQILKTHHKSQPATNEFNTPTFALSPPKGIFITILVLFIILCPPISLRLAQLISRNLTFALYFYFYFTWLPNSVRRSSFSSSSSSTFLRLNHIFLWFNAEIRALHGFSHSQRGISLQSFSIFVFVSIFFFSLIVCVWRSPFFYSGFVSPIFVCLIAQKAWENKNKTKQKRIQFRGFCTFCLWLFALPK